MQRFYEETLKSLAEAKNDVCEVPRMALTSSAPQPEDKSQAGQALARSPRVRTSDQGALRLDRRLKRQLLRELHASVAAKSADADGDADNTRGAILLEIYALEIQMYGETKDNKKLREIYDKTLHVRSAVPHPRIMGIIRECGGKMHMSEKEWTKAQVDFFEAFRNYDEAGSTRRISVLKYLVLSHMLMASRVNPFDSQETAVYKNDPEIVAMTGVRANKAELKRRSCARLPREQRTRGREDHSRQPRNHHLGSFHPDPHCRRAAFAAHSVDRGHHQDVHADLARLPGSPARDSGRRGRRFGGRPSARRTRARQDRSSATDPDPRFPVRAGGGCADRRRASLDARRYASLDRWTNELRRLQNSLAAKLPQTGSSLPVEAW